VRVGTGFDAHRLVKNRPLILGGVTICHELGLLGHSDADVLVHAIMDALLGALALGDIGRHFPDSDAAYREASSLKLLAQVAILCRREGFEIGNIDAVIIAERPKLASYITQIRENIAKILCLSPEKISVKATTTEGMGFCGRGEGIAAQATVLLLSG